MTLELIILGAALVLLGVVVEVVRRRRLSENYALLWIGVGVGGLVLGAARPLVDRVSSAVGIAYGTSLVFALACLFLTVVCINLTVHVSRLEERVEVLAQEVALRAAEHSDGPRRAEGHGAGPVAGTSAVASSADPVRPPPAPPDSVDVAGGGQAAPAPADGLDRQLG